MLDELALEDEEMVPSIPPVIPSIAASQGFFSMADKFRSPSSARCVEPTSLPPPPCTSPSRAAPLVYGSHTPPLLTLSRSSCSVPMSPSAPSLDRAPTPFLCSPVHGAESMTASALSTTIVSASSTLARPSSFSAGARFSSPVFQLDFTPALNISAIPHLPSVAPVDSSSLSPELSSLGNSGQSPFQAVGMSSSPQPSFGLIPSVGLPTSTSPNLAEVLTAPAEVAASEVRTKRT